MTLAPLSVWRTIAVFVSLSVTVFAQPGNRNDRVVGINVGDPIPDVTGISEDGKELKLTSLKGSPAVLVFGCLT